MSNDPLYILTQARELLSDPKKWTKHAIARKNNGNFVAADSEKAVCWCAMGAMHRFGNAWRTKVEKYFYTANEISDYCVEDWNNAKERTHDDVLKAFDKAIELAKNDHA